MSSCMEKDIEKILLSQEELKNRVAQLGAQISADYAGTEPQGPQRFH